MADFTTAVKVTRVEEFGLCSLKDAAERILNTRNYPSEILMNASQREEVADFCADQLLTVDLSSINESVSAGSLKCILALFIILQLGYESQQEDADQMAEQLEAANCQLLERHRLAEEHEAVRLLGLDAKHGGGKKLGELQEQVASLSTTMRELRTTAADAEKQRAEVQKECDSLRACERILREKLEQQEMATREKEQELALAKELLDGLGEEAKVQMGQGAPINSEKAVSDREQSLLAQLDDVESRYQQLLADGQHELNSAKTENITLCLELKDIGQLAQQEQRNVRQLEASLAARDETIAEQQKSLRNVAIDLEEQLALHSQLVNRMEIKQQEVEQESVMVKKKLAALMHKSGLQASAADSGPVGVEAASEAVKELEGEKVQLLEAYQLLEQDTGRLIDDAVSQHVTKNKEMAADLQEQQQAMAVLRSQCRDQEAMLRDLETQLQLARSDVQKLAAHETSLPEVLIELNEMRGKLQQAERECDNIVHQKQGQEDYCDYLKEQFQDLRKKLQLPDETKVYDEWKQHRASRVAQLEALNAELERIICDLEDERKKDRETRKFCAQYHGKCGTGQAEHSATAHDLADFALH